MARGRVSENEFQEFYKQTRDHAIRSIFWLDLFDHHGTELP